MPLSLNTADGGFGDTGMVVRRTTRADFSTPYGAWSYKKGGAHPWRHLYGSFKIYVFQLIAVPAISAAVLWSRQGAECRQGSTECKVTSFRHSGFDIEDWQVRHGLPALIQGRCSSQSESNLVMHNMHSRAAVTPTGRITVEGSSRQPFSLEDKATNREGWRPARRPK